MPAASKNARFFISYRSQDPDLSLAQNFYKAIKDAGHEAFMAGESIRLGEKWPQRIDEELKLCDYFLLLLSERSATSEMVTEEVRQTKQLRDGNDQHKPVILPIRVNFPWSTPLNYDLRGYLQQIQQREWNSPADTPKILKEIFSLLADSESERVENWEIGELRDEQLFFPIAPFPHPPLPVAEPELPEGQVDLTSDFYIQRPPIESRCYEEILKSGALIRIKAARQMGKTSLMARILHHARQQSCSTVQLSFQLADSEVFANLDKFLRWFCASVTHRLDLPNRLGDYWDKTCGSKDNCTSYFERYLLSSINQPLVLALDEVDCVFQQPKIASDFFGLLRAWHEDTKSRDIWKKLRLVVVHSTEPYISMDVNQSPFNVGLPIELPEFNRQQVLDLARRYGLNWNITQVEQLTAMLGGHPYLVRVGLYHISRQQTTLEQLLKIAPTDAGIFSDHLRRHWWNLKQHPELMDAIAQIVSATNPVELDPILAFKLKSMGLIAWENNRVILRCNLYREYFHQLTHSVTAQEPVQNQPTNPAPKPLQQLPPVQPANPTQNLVYEYQVGGSLPPNALSYVERKADKDLYDELKAGNFCYVLSSRQMGKSSLRVRTMQKLQVEGIACAVIDLTEIGSQELSSEQWYAGIVRRLERSFQLSVKFNFSSWWSNRSHISPVQRLGEFIDEVLLVEIPQNIVIFIDEIDSVLSLKFPTDDFFALIRNFYNRRADNLKYQRITFTLLGVATPSDFVQDKKRTPFNIGKGIELKGFQLEEAKPLAVGLAGKFKNPKEALERVLHWTGGQPFLTHKVCQLIQTNNQRLSVDDVVRLHIIENWEAQDEQAHLRTIRDRILTNGEGASRLLGLYQQILQHGEISVDDSSEQIHLRLTGLVVEQQGKLRVYNRIYASVFTLYWVETELAKLRPYAETFAAWVASNYQDESRLLHGQALHDALAWAANKSLSSQDSRFLRNSQEFDKREVQRAFEAEKEAHQLLAKAQQKSKLTIISGLIGLLVIGAAAIGIVLWARNQAMVQAQQEVQQSQQQAQQAQQEVQQSQQQAQQARQQAQQAQQQVQQQAIDLNDARTRITKINTNAEELVLEAIDLYQRGIYDEALSKLKSAEDKDDVGTRLPVSYFRGEISRMTAKYEEAVKEYTTAINDNYYLTFALARRGDTYFRMALNQQLGSQYQLISLDNALNDLNIALKQSPTYGFALSSRGQAHFQMVLFQAANRQYFCDSLGKAENDLQEAIFYNFNNQEIKNTLQRVMIYKSQCSQR